jgi:outer membrane protein TolC
MFTACRIIGASAVLALLPVHAVAAQVPLSLSEAVEQARQQHPRIDVALAAEEAATNRTEQAGKWANPHVFVYQENFPGTMPDIDQTIISVTQRVRIGGQLGLAKTSAQALRDAAMADLYMTVEQLGFFVQRTYADLYRIQGSLGALDDARRTVDRLLRDLDVRVREGDASRFDLLRMRLAWDGVRAGQARVRAEQVAGWERLAFLIGRAVPRAGWILENPLGTTYGPPALEESPMLVAAGSRLAAAPSELEQAVDNRFDAQAMAFRRQAAASRAEAVGKEAIPDLVVTLGYTRLDPVFNGLVWSVGVDIPLFDRKGEAKAAQLAEARGLDREYEVLLKEASSEVRAASAEFAQLAEALVELQQGAELGELLPIATIAYEEGEITVTGLLDAARAQLDSRLRELELAQAMADAWYRWRYASGRFVGGARP